MDNYEELTGSISKVDFDISSSAQKSKKTSPWRSKRIIDNVILSSQSIRCL